MTTSISEENKIIRDLDQVLQNASIKEIIESKVLEAENELLKNNTTSITKTVPISVFKDKLPDSINLCRVYILHANTKAKVEKHVNSIQRVMSYKDSGNIRILSNNEWKDNFLESRGDTNVHSRWLTVKEDTWHQPISYSKNWVTVTFHTASESQIIDVYKN